MYILNCFLGEFCMLACKLVLFIFFGLGLDCPMILDNVSFAPSILDVAGLAWLFKGNMSLMQVIFLSHQLLIIESCFKRLAILSNC